MTAHYIADTDALGLGRPDHEPLATETIDAIVALIAALIERGAAYAVDGDVYFRVRRDPSYGALSHRAARRDGPGRGRRDRRPGLKEDPLDFALWKAQKEGEDTAWDAPWGRGRPGWHIECSAMAEELLGVGFDVHGGGNDLVFPHHENEAAQTRMARDAELARIWMHNGMLQMGGGEDGQVGRQHRAAARRRSSAWGRDALVLFFSTATTASRCASPTRRSPRPQTRGRGACASSAGRLAPGPSPDGPGAAEGALLRRAGRRLQHPAGARGAGEWVREANSARGRRGRAPTCARCSASSASRTCSTRVEGAARGGRRAGRGAPGRARGARLRPRRPPARRDRRARLDRPRRRRRASSSSPRRVIVYGRNPVHEALRAGRRPVHARVGDQGRGARAVAAAGVRVDASTRRSDRRPAAAATPTRASAPRPGPTPTPTRRSCSRRPTRADRRARRGPGRPEPRRDRADGRVRRARPACVHPRAPRAEVTPAACKASAGAVEHLPIARVRNLADFLADAKAAGCGATARRPTAAAPYDGARLHGRVVLVLGAEGKGLRPRVAAAATSSWRCRCAAAWSR